MKDELEYTIEEIGDETEIDTIATEFLKLLTPQRLYTNIFEKDE